MSLRIFITFFLLFVNLLFSQNESIKDLVRKTDSLDLDMWELSDFARKNIDNQKDLAFFFYYWIGSNISYDYNFLMKIVKNEYTYDEYLKKQDEYQVYQNREAICAGYANLFQWFMNEVDIESIYIRGHIRDQRNHYVEIGLDDDFRHAWNAIKLNNKWQIVDSTWGTSFNPEVSEFYFNMKPELAIISHFPEDEKWQLLKNPLTLKEFNNSKFIDPIWFFNGFSDIPKLKADKNYYYFVFKSNPNKNLSIELLSSTNNLDFKMIEKTVIINQNGYTYIRFNKPESTTSFYKVNLKKHGEVVYFDVINFKTQS